MIHVAFQQSTVQVSEKTCKTMEIRTQMIIIYYVLNRYFLIFTSSHASCVLLSSIVIFFICTLFLLIFILTASIFTYTVDVSMLTQITCIVFYRVPFLLLFAFEFANLMLLILLPYF